MNFSLLLPTRNRPRLLCNLYNSIKVNTSDLRDIEMLVVYDEDDTETASVAPALLDSWVRFFSRPRGSSLSRDYQNWLYPFTRGQYIFVLNDDVEIKTKKWDQIAINKINQYLQMYPDGVFYGWTADSSVLRIHQAENAYACFPILSRQAIDILGYVMHEHYGGWSADVFLYNVYRDALSILDLSEILVQHYSHWLGNRERDETNKSMESKSTQTDIIDHRPDTAKLLRHIRRPIFL